MSGRMIRALAAENGERRGLTGQGTPGLHTLLGGTGVEGDISTYRIGGGAGQTSATAQLARAHKDARLAAQVSGTLPSSGGGKVGGEGLDWLKPRGPGEGEQAR